MNRIHRHHRTLCLAAFLLLAVACQSPSGPATTSEPSPDVTATQEDPRALLADARQAAIAVRGVRYRFEFGQSAGPSTWATGETSMLHRTDIGDSLIRVTGRLRNWDEEPAPFLYSTDGRTTWSLDPGQQAAEIRTVGEGDRALGGLAVYGYLTEFIEGQPYWKELEQSDSLRSLPPEKVGDVDCHVVEVLYDRGTARETRHLWYLAVDDLLPRGLRWYDPTTPEGSEFWLYDLQTVDLAAGDFAVEVPEGFEVADYRRASEAEDAGWSLTSSRGEAVSLEELWGKVVVLDLWNTWCMVCRALQPQMGELAARYEGADSEVVFYGVNVFELEDADPAAYWAGLGHPYDYLADGDEVARLYDVPWQPGVVVLDRRGEVAFSLVGGTGTRQQQITEAIERSLRAEI